jgi:hypothetical protein
VNLVTHQALDRDCRSAKVHDFQRAKAGRERQVALAYLDEPEHQDGLEQHQARPLRGALRTPGRKARRDVPRQARMVELRAQTDELVLAQAHWVLALRASLQLAQEEQEQAPSAQPARRPELQPQALPAPRAWRSVLQAQLVLQQLAQRWLVAEGQARLQSSFARPSSQHPWRPSPLWLWLRRQLRLLLVPGDSCGPFRRHPQGSSWNASFFPLRRTRAKGQ